jgi:Cadherin domain
MLNRYSLLPGAGVDRFSIDPWSGAISTAVSLNYEDQSAYSLVVMATDCGLIPLSGTASVQVTVLDSNDNAPRFTKSSYSMQLYRSLNAGEFQS